MSGKRFEGDPTEALRRADPLDRRPVPDDAVEAHRRALFQEMTSMDTMEREAPAPGRRRGLRIAVAASAVAALAAAVIGGYALFGGGTEPRVVGGEPIGGGGMAMCIQYTDELLAQQAYAFDGTVTSIEGSTVTFEVNHWYKGGDGATLTLSAEGLTGGPNSIMEGLTPVEVGQRYLASGNDGFLWACGYTLTYDSDLADHWSELFGA